MKKTLSLVLALVMILGSFSTVFAADTTTAVDTASKFLKEQGVLVGDGKDLMLDQNLLRQDTAILVSILMGEQDEAAKFEGTVAYKDIRDNFYLPVLAWAQTNGTFKGHSDVNFGFGENITAQQYAKVLLTVLGYSVDPNGKADVNYDNALAKAKELGILADVTVENNTEILRSEMAVMTFNALGVVVKGGTKTLAETLNIEMPEAPAAKELKAEVKDTKNLKEVVLELSNAKLADEDKLQNVNNYKIVDHDVERVEVKDNDVFVQVKGTFVEGRKYTLRVRSIDKAIDKEYEFVAKDNTSPKVEKVEALGEYGIKITASEPIRVLDTNRGRSFVVDGKSIAMNVESYGRDLILTPYYNDSFSKDAKTLTVEGLEDFAGYKSAKEDFEIEIVRDEVAPKVVDVILRGNNKVEVVFDKDVYQSTVKKYYNRSSVGNISYVSGRETVYATGAKKIDTNKVEYEFKDELLRLRTDFTIVDVANHSKVAMEKTTMAAREILDNIEPEIFKNEVTNNTETGKATIKLFFDKDVEGVWEDASNTEFNLNSHFKLFGEKLGAVTTGKIESAKYHVDSKTGKVNKDIIVVELSGLVDRTASNEIDYILQIENFTDASSRRNNRMYRDYVEFEFTEDSGFAVVSEGVTVSNQSNGTHINVKFNSSVDRVIAEDPTNYIFEKNNGARLDVRELNGRIITEKNGTEVTIILPNFDKDDYKEFRISEALKDRFGNRLASTYVYNFALELVMNDDKYTIAETSAGVYNVNVKTGVKEITLTTGVNAVFHVIDGGSALKTVTINTPNGTVHVPAGVTKVEVKAIAGNSLHVSGKLDLVVSTAKKFNVHAANSADITISSTVATAEVVVITATTTTIETVKKGEVIEVKVDASGNIAVTIANPNEKVENKLDEITGAVTTGSGITLEVAEAAAKKDRVKVTKAIENLMISKKVAVADSADYEIKVTVSRLEQDPTTGEFNKASVRFVLTEKADKTKVAEVTETYNLSYTVK